MKLIDNALLTQMHEQARDNERLRCAFDLRTTSEDGSQRMLNVLQPGTHVAIHRHLKSDETNITRWRN